jgi:hypothetical protein
MPVLAVIGSRSFNYQDRVWEYLDKVLEKTENLSLVSGACPQGADALAESWAKRRGVPILLYPADWSKGKGAGFARNQKIVKAADVVVCFWDGTSKGTVDSIERAWRLGIKVMVSTPQNPKMVLVKDFMELAQRACLHPGMRDWSTGTSTFCPDCNHVFNVQDNPTQ